MRILLSLAMLIAMTAAAAAYPCPSPKRYYCWQIKAAAAAFGADALEAHARSCGWTELQITVAKRCLK